MRSLVGGIALVLVAAFMLMGFLRSSMTLGNPSALFALLLTVGLPGFFGGRLLLRHFGAGRVRDSRRDQLRRQTLEAEVLRLARDRAGRLALVDVVTELAVPSEEAQAALDSLTTQEIADIAITDSGTLVYTFRDVEKMGDRTKARPILE